MCKRNQFIVARHIDRSMIPKGIHDKSTLEIDNIVTISNIYTSPTTYLYTNRGDMIKQLLAIKSNSP
jgi:hypothetical protein